MKKINLRDIVEESWSSPKGKYTGSSQELSVALGRKPLSTDLNERHPFDVELCRIPPGKAAYPFHSHSAQWEFYHVVSGVGIVRHENGETPIEPGDAFVFKPGEPHQLTATGTQDLLVWVVADNPIGETCHYPDSGKWLVRSPERAMIRSQPVEFYAGEE